MLSLQGTYIEVTHLIFNMDKIMSLCDWLFSS